MLLVTLVHACGCKSGLQTILEGQLAIKLPNPQMMLGYWNEPERTAAGKARVGNDEYWLTGDVIRQDDDGYLFYEGRADHIISSAGYRTEQSAARS